MLLAVTQRLINEYGKQFINGTLTNKDLDTLYNGCFQAVGGKIPSDTPSDLAFTKMEAMLDFVITIGSQMSEKQLENTMIDFYQKKAKDILGRLDETLERIDKLQKVAEDSKKNSGVGSQALLNDLLNILNDIDIEGKSLEDLVNPVKNEPRFPSIM